MVGRVGSRGRFFYMNDNGNYRTSKREASEGCRSSIVGREGLASPIHSGAARGPLLRHFRTRGLLGCGVVRDRRLIGIDLFAGAGGLSLGFEQAGFDVATAIDIDPVHCAVHEYNFPRCATLCRSVADLEAGELRALAGIRGREVAVVFGGAPCQGFSMIGKRALDDPRNDLVRHFVRLVRAAVAPQVTIRAQPERRWRAARSSLSAHRLRS